MKIPTVNIVVGFNKEVMERLFVAGATYKSLIQGLSVSGQDILLFDNVSNPNFISFEHTMNLGSGWKMQLTLLDPKQEFENRYISDNIIKNIAGYMYNDSQNTDKDSTNSKVNEKIQESLNAYGDEFINEFANEYTEQFNTKEIYVAYGTGNNLDLWAGPHRSVLVNMDVSVKGARKITLKLQPSPMDLNINHRRGAYNERVNLNLAGLTMRTSGDSQPIKFYTEKEGKITQSGPKYDPLEWLGALNPTDPYASGARSATSYRDILNKGLKKELKSLNFDFVASQIGEMDFHSIIVDALRNYIQNATSNPNVIVLLPNLNIICRQWIEESAKNARVTWLDPAGVPDLAAQREFKYYFLEKLLESFCLELISETPDKKTVIPQAAVNKHKEHEQAVSPQQRYTQYFTRKFVARLEKASDRGIPDHMAALQSVLNKILQYSKESYQIQIGHFTETDINILNLWTQGVPFLPTHKFPIFGGYSLFNESKEAVIYGDIALIQEYLYGRTSTKEQNEGLADLQKKAVLAQKDYEFASVHDPMYAEVGPDGTSVKAFKDSAGAEKKLTSAKIAALLHIPLHPLDHIILRNQDYNSAIRKLAYPPITGVGSFGDISYIPDEFAYLTENDIKNSKAAEEGVPIFRYNTQNPNILDMNFKFGPIYFAQLNSKFKKMVRRRASGVVAGVLPVGIGSFPITNRGDAAAFLREDYFSLGLGLPESQTRREHLARLMDPKLVESMMAPNALEAADAIAAGLQASRITNFASIVEIEQKLPGNPQTILTEFMDGVYRDALQMTIKTLPLFHLSAQHTMGRPCIVFAQDAAVEQSNPPDRSLINSFFSGEYKIMGFTHTITAGASQSEFKLIKNVAKYKSGSDIEPMTSAEREVLMQLRERQEELNSTRSIGWS